MSKARVIGPANKPEQKGDGAASKDVKVCEGMKLVLMDSALQEKQRKKQLKQQQKRKGKYDTLTMEDASSVACEDASIRCVYTGDMDDSALIKLPATPKAPKPKPTASLLGTTDEEDEDDQEEEEEFPTFHIPFSWKEQQKDKLNDIFSQRKAVAVREMAQALNKEEDGGKKGGANKKGGAKSLHLRRVHSDKSLNMRRSNSIDSVSIDDEGAPLTKKKNDNTSPITRDNGRVRRCHSARSLLLQQDDDSSSESPSDSEQKNRKDDQRAFLREGRVRRSNSARDLFLQETASEAGEDTKQEDNNDNDNDKRSNLLLQSRKQRSSRRNLVMRTDSSQGLDQFFKRSNSSKSLTTTANKSGSSRSLAGRLNDNKAPPQRNVKRTSSGQALKRLGLKRNSTASSVVSTMSHHIRKVGSAPRLQRMRSCEDIVIRKSTSSQQLKNAKWPSSKKRSTTPPPPRSRRSLTRITSGEEMEPPDSVAAAKGGERHSRSRRCSLRRNLTDDEGGLPERRDSSNSNNNDRRTRRKSARDDLQRGSSHSSRLSFNSSNSSLNHLPSDAEEEANNNNNETKGKRKDKRDKHRRTSAGEQHDNRSPHRSKSGRSVAGKKKAGAKSKGDQKRAPGLKRTNTTDDAATSKNERPLNKTTRAGSERRLNLDQGLKRIGSNRKVGPADETSVGSRSRSSRGIPNDGSARPGMNRTGSGRRINLDQCLKRIGSNRKIGPADETSVGSRSRSSKDLPKDGSVRPGMKRTGSGRRTNLEHGLKRSDSSKKLAADGSKSVSGLRRASSSRNILQTESSQPGIRRTASGTNIGRMMDLEQGLRRVGSGRKLSSGDSKSVHGRVQSSSARQSFRRTLSGRSLAGMGLAHEESGNDPIKRSSSSKKVASLKGSGSQGANSSGDLKTMLNHEVPARPPPFRRCQSGGSIHYRSSHRRRHGTEESLRGPRIQDISQKIWGAGKENGNEGKPSVNDQKMRTGNEPASNKAASSAESVAKNGISNGDETIVEADKGNNCKEHENTAGEVQEKGAKIDAVDQPTTNDSEQTRSLDTDQTQTKTKDEVPVRSTGAEGTAVPDPKREGDKGQQKHSSPSDHKEKDDESTQRTSLSDSNSNTHGDNSTNDDAEPQHEKDDKGQKKLLTSADKEKDGSRDSNSNAQNESSFKGNNAAPGDGGIRRAFSDPDVLLSMDDSDKEHVKFSQGRVKRSGSTSCIKRSGTRSKSIRGNRTSSPKRPSTKGDTTHNDDNNKTCSGRSSRRKESLKNFSSSDLTELNKQKESGDRRERRRSSSKSREESRRSSSKNREIVEERRRRGSSKIGEERRRSSSKGKLGDTKSSSRRSKRPSGSKGGSRTELEVPLAKDNDTNTNVNVTTSESDGAKAETVQNDNDAPSSEKSERLAELKEKWKDAKSLVDTSSCGVVTSS